MIVKTPDSNISALEPAGEAELTEFQKACVRILNSRSKYIPEAKQEHERTKQIYRAKRKAGVQK